MKIKIIVGLGILLAFPSFAQTLDSCDPIYSRRGADLLKAVDCYQNATANLSGDQKRSGFERSFIALSAVVNDQPKTQGEIDAITRGLRLVDEFSMGFSNTADFFYWRAVFTSFDALQKDRGSALPRHLFGVLKQLQDDLRRAIAMDPKVHSYGPSRVLGIMHTQMPGIVGGDKTLAEKLLKDAYDHAPAMCANHTAYAKILQVNGKDNEAKAALNRFLKLTDSDLNPYPGSPNRSLKPENDRERKIAKDLLASIGDED
jgi:hypothetical protein